MMNNPVTQFNRSLSWIFESYQIYNDQPETTIRDAFDKYMLDGKCVLINHGLLIAACYLYFLYPKERGARDVYVNPEKFISDYNKNDFARRIRNALAHGGIEIKDDGNICFVDNNKNKTDPFKANITPIDLAELVENIGREYVNGG